MKKLLIVPMLFLLMLMLSSCTKDLLAIDQIDSIKLTPNSFLGADEKLYTKTDDKSSSIKDLGTLINGLLGLLEDQNHIMNNDFIITLTYPATETKMLCLDIDLDLQKGYIFDGKSTHLIEGSNYKKLVNSVYFNDYLLLIFLAPTLSLVNNGTSIDYKSEGEFSYQWFNNSIKTYSLPAPETSVTSITLDDIETPLSLEFDTTPTALVQNTYSNGTLVSTVTLTSNQIQLPVNDGDFQIELTATWDENPDYSFRGEVKYSISLIIDLPAAFSISSTNLQPGECFVITAKNVNDGQLLSVVAPFYDKPLAFYPYNNDYVCILPIYSFTEPNFYDISLTTTEPLTVLENSTKLMVEIVYKEFEEQHLIVSESTLALRNADNEASDQLLIDEARSNPYSEKLWEGAFLKPTEGILTTDYAVIRYTNDNPEPSRHSGIDLANVTGTPIYAANNGYVTLAQTLYITGNTIIIDHGMGIFTYYYHLEEMLVENGAYVKKGDLIAKMGTTGFSTGSHLHFTLSKDAVHINPWIFFEKDLLAY